MLMVCHHLDPGIPEDVAFAESRIRRETIAAEDILHDLGAISMMSSDSQAMGRVGEVIIRTWQTAHKMKQQRGPLPADATARAQRQLPRQALHRQVHDQPGDHPRHRHEVGSIEVGKLADLVLWQPAFFGVEAGAGHQGRADRRGADGRSERLDPDAAAGALPADVRRAGRRAARDLGDVRVGGGARGRASGAARAGKRARGGAGHADRPQARHGPQRRAAGHRGRPQTYEVRADGELLDVRAGDVAAAGAAVFSVLRRDAQDARPERGPDAAFHGGAWRR